MQEKLLACPACHHNPFTMGKIEIYTPNSGRHNTISHNGWVDTDHDLSDNPLNGERSLLVHFHCPACGATSGLIVGNGFTKLELRSKGVA